MAPTLTELPGGLLTVILLRLPAPEDLARASAACPAFRRVATDGAFLCRFRRLHAPRLLAFIDLDGFQPALPPHPSAPAARALARAADFSFSFLPSHCRWVPMDVRDGRVLLGRDHGQDARPPICRELAVCDPLHRRYVLLPPLPDALVASVVRPPAVHAHAVRMPFDEPLLLPLGENGVAAEGTAFTVISMVHCETKLAPFVFSSTTGQWRAAAPMLWSDMPVSPMDHTYLRRHHAYGCFYWESTLIKRRELLVLNIQRMEFSIAELPSSGWGTLGVAIVEAGEGRLGLFGIRDGTAGGKPDLCYTVRHNKGKNSGQWQMVKTFSLGSEGLNYLKAATERYVLLICSEAPRFVGLSMEMPELEYISVDVKKLQLERVCVKPFGNSLSRTRIYAHFPPSLSSPTI